MAAVAEFSSVRSEHVDAWRRLEKIVRHYRGFRLALALYNDPPAYRDSLRDQLSRLVALPRVVNARDCANFADFEAQLAEASAGADLVQIVGLDAWLREAVGRTRMEGFNLHRESLAQSCGTLLVLWLPVHLVAELAQAAPDFWEWRLVVVDFCVARAGVLPDGLEATLNRIHRVRRAGLPVEATALGVPDEEWGHARFNLEASRVEQASNLGRLGEALDLAEGLYRRAVAAGEEAYPNADLDLAAACWFFGRTLCRGGAAEAALPVLVEAEQRFERIEDMRPNSGAQRMATILALTELGNCLAVLGRYKRAVEVYERSISRAQKQGDARQVAIGKGQLGTVRLLQGRYSEALSIYTAARDSFAALDEPSEVAAAWHQIGRVHQETDDYAAAEHAYQKSLNIEIEQKNVAGQASTIGQLGNLYDRMNRLEDAAAFHGQAADKFATLGDLANEGKARNNLAGTFRKLNRLTKARAQIRRAIECNEAYGHATQPWSFWETFCDIETAHDQPQAATATRQRALECFLSYRRDGGENHDGPGRLCAHMSEWLSLNKSDKASETLRTLWTDPNLLSHLSPLLDALDAIAAGSRDPALADNPALSYDQAAEIILLLERLNQPAAPANLPTTKP